MKPLYEIANQYQKAVIDLTDLELPDDVIADTLEGLKGDIIIKGTNVAAMFRNLEAESLAIKNAEQMMKARRTSIDKRVAWMKKYLLDNMIATDTTEISCPHFVIKTRKNPAAVKITDEITLPHKYKKETLVINIDKKAIATDLKAGEIINGAELTHGMRLDIK